ncbi:MAG: PstS family phosphate ABC transporter substrate-binding protein [Planctomycetota bacterium]|jgi:phosphate transport system substrate-binding protein
MRWLGLGLLTLVFACGGDRKGRAVIQNKGSDTLVNVAQAWAERYKEVNPKVAIAVSGGGSGTGISALINGTVDLANASRKMKPREIEAARKNGVEPVEHIVGFDALAVYVHTDNPVKGFTLEELAAIYGEGGTTENWRQLGLDFKQAKDGKIVRVSRQNNSGTYAYFKKAVLGKKREYKLGSLDMHGSKDVVDLVAKTPGAIGYSGLAYATDEVRLAPVAKTKGAEYVAPSVESAASGRYPIARPLFVYTRGEPTGAVKEYLDWVLSDAGQRILLEKGYAPVRKIDQPQ